MGGERRFQENNALGYFEALLLCLGSTEGFLVGPPAQKPLSALPRSNPGFGFFFVSFRFFVLFPSGLTLIFGGMQCFSGSPDPLRGLPHKGAPADWEQCPWNGHSKTGLKPAMAKLEPGAGADILKLLPRSFPLHAEGPKKRNGWLRQLVVCCCCCCFLNSKRKRVLFSLIFLYLFPAKETVS